MSSKGITSSYEVARDGAGNSTSITWTFKKYSNCTYETQNRQIDAEGTMEDLEVSVYSEDDLIDTQSITYVIPEDQKTTATHEEPHVHENEMAFQAAYTVWAENHRESEAGLSFWTTFGTYT